MPFICVTKQPWLFIRTAFFGAIAITVLGTVPLAFSSDPAPSAPPTLPSKVRWICDEVTRYPDSSISKVREVLISDGTRWRLEYQRIQGKTHVAV